MTSLFISLSLLGVPIIILNPFVSVVFSLVLSVSVPYHQRRNFPFNVFVCPGYFCALITVTEEICS